MKTTELVPRTEKMSNSLCKSSVFKTYQDVISDVIHNVREHFLEDGVDETVLQELKSLWETKLVATKAVEEIKEVDKIIAVNNKAQKLQQQQQQHFLNHIVQQQNQAKQLIGQVPPNNHIPQGIAFPEWRRVPVQLTIPSPPGCGTGEQRILGIEVPEIFLQGHHLKSILTGPIISATLNLPLEAATTFLQDQVNNAFLKHQQSTNFININMDLNSSILQADGCFTEEEYAISPHISIKNFSVTRYSQQASRCINCNSRSCSDVKFKKKRHKNTIDEEPDIKRNYLHRRNPHTKHTFNITIALINNNSNLNSCKISKIYQGDGTHSSSDEVDLDDDDDDNDNEEDDELNVDIEGETQEAAEDEPLNSEDDVSDADGTEESFETDNVIVCQFDKITRARNRWKFHLKDGIMNLSGEDYVFQKANGDAEW